MNWKLPLMISLLCLFGVYGKEHVCLGPLLVSLSLEEHMDK
jgi:hypothetical protein